jgi:hypothetical protein
VEVAVTTATAAREIASADFVASAPSGKAFTGQAGLSADATGAGSCIIHGHAALQG